MYTVYRKSLWKSSVFYTFLPPTIFGAVVLMLSFDVRNIQYWNYANWIASGFIFLILGAIYWFGLVKYSFYVVATSSSIMVKNLFIPLLDKEYRYSDISKCLISSVPRGNIYMQFLTANSPKWSTFYGVELVCKEDLESIRSTLLQNGITVVDKKS